MCAEKYKKIFLHIFSPSLLSSSNSPLISVPNSKRAIKKCSKTEMTNYFLKLVFHLPLTKMSRKKFLLFFFLLLFTDSFKSNSFMQKKRLFSWIMVTFFFFFSYFSYDFFAVVGGFLNLTPPLKRYRQGIMLGIAA